MALHQLLSATALWLIIIGGGLFQIRKAVNVLVFVLVNLLVYFPILPVPLVPAVA